MFFSRNWNWLLISLLLLPGCSRKPELTSSGPRRVGIFLFENLSSDATLDWVGRAASSVISSQLGSLPNVIPVDLVSLRDAEQAKVNELVQGYYVVSSGGELRLTAQLRDAAPSKNVRLISASGNLSSGLLPLADSIARQITPAAHPYVTKSEEAVRELFQGVEGQGQDQLLAHTELALKADPGFGPAYLIRTQVLASRGDVNGAKAALAQASQYAKNFSETDRAKLEMMQANLGGSRAEKTEALSHLVAALPTDLPALDALANLQIVNKNFAAAVKTYQAALKVEPNNVIFINSLAYVQAFAGDLAGATASIQAYRKAAPNDANADDTLGEINFFAGRYAEAERNFVEAYRRNKALVNGHELYRAAVAALLGGNRKSADEHYKEYMAALKAANDSLLPVREGIWAYQTGDKSGGAQLQKLAGDTGSVAHAQLAIWLLDAGQRDKAKEQVIEALKLATTPGSKNFAAVTGFLAAPKVPAAEWKRRAEQAAPKQLALQQQVLGYALLLSGEYADAAPVWKSIYDEGGLDAMGEPKVFLAYCYLKSGKKQEAAELMKTGILPPKSLDPGVPSLIVPKYLSLR